MLICCCFTHVRNVSAVSACCIYQQIGPMVVWWSFDFNQDTFVASHINCYVPAQGALSDDAVWHLSVWRMSVWRLSVWHLSCTSGRQAGWRVLADQAWLGRPGSRLPLRSSIAGLGWGISWRQPAYSLLFLQSADQVLVLGCHFVALHYYNLLQEVTQID